MEKKLGEKLAYLVKISHYIELSCIVKMKQKTMYCATFIWYEEGNVYKEEMVHLGKEDYRELSEIIVRT